MQRSLSRDGSAENVRRSAQAFKPCFLLSLLGREDEDKEDKSRGAGGRRRVGAGGGARRMTLSTAGHSLMASEQRMWQLREVPKVSMRSSSR